MVRNADEVWLRPVVLADEDVGAEGAVIVEAVVPSADGAGTTSVVGPVNEVTKPEDVLALLLLEIVEEDELGGELALAFALELGELVAGSIDEDDREDEDAEEKADGGEDDDENEDEDKGDGVALAECEDEDELVAPTVIVDILEEEWLAVSVEGTGIAGESLGTGEPNEPCMELMVKKVENSWYVAPSTGLTDVKLM